MFLYSGTVSSPLDHSKRFILHTPPPPVADLLIPTPTQLLLEAFSHAAITALRLLLRLIFPPLSIVRYSQHHKLRRRRENENAQASKWQRKQFEPGFPQLSGVPLTLSGIDPMCCVILDQLPTHFCIFLPFTMLSVKIISMYKQLLVAMYKQLLMCPYQMLLLIIYW